VCPSVYVPVAGDKSIFLGGGISGCQNWQEAAKDVLTKQSPHLILLNPRREKFDVSDKTLAEKQIRWEFDHLRLAKAVLFWFPPETLCPITLYELGTWSVLSQTTGAHLFVGCHKDYQRKQDVEIQTKLIRPDVQVHSTLEDLLDDVATWANVEQ